MFKNLEEIKKTFLSLDDEERYDYILEFSNEKGNYPKSKINEKYRVLGCVSEVYIYLFKKNDKIYFQAKTDSIFVLSYINILISCLNGISRQEFLKSSKKEIEDFLTQTNIQKSLTPTRANTFGNIYLKMEELVLNLD